MNFRSLLWLAALGLTTVAAPAADNPAPAADTAVYLSPDASKPALLKVSASDARLASAKPVADAALAATGWRVVSLPGPFTGYVPTKTSHKDFSITPGTPVHLTADDASPVLGLAPDQPRISISSPGADWSEVSFPGPVTAYFLAAPPTSPEPPKPAATPAPAPAPAPAASTTPPTVFTPVAAVAPTIAAKTTSAADVGHYYYGVLKVRTDPTLGGPTNAHYVLYSSKGQVLALVDLNDVVLPSPLVQYLDKTAKVFGTAYPDAHQPYPVIHALSLQSATQF